MNDQKLKEQLSRLRIPQHDPGVENAALEVALSAFRAASKAETVQAIAERWTWRDWMWPSPLAWVGLAAVWLIVLARSATDQTAVEPLTTPLRADKESSRALGPLLAGHDFEELLRQFHEDRRTP